MANTTQSNDVIRLVTRCDDIGSSISANRAGIDAIENGVAKNISMMMCCDAFEDAAPHYAGRKDCAMGLHVTLNCEWKTLKWGPVLPREKVPSLVDENGHFLPFPQDNHNRGLDVEQAIAEIKAQLERARKAGINVEYVDQHMGVGWVNNLDSALNELIKREGLLNTRGLGKRLPNKSKGGVLESWIEGIETAEPGDYLVVTHPTFNDESAREMGDEIAAARDLDRLALTDPRLREALAKRGGKAVRYTEL